MASFASILEPEDHSSPFTNKSELTDLLLRTNIVLDHDDEDRHGEEVADEVHIVLFRALQEATSHSYESEDATLALDSLHKLLRCSNHVAREIFFGGCGVPLLQLIFLLAEMNHRLGNRHIVSTCKSIIDRFATLQIDLGSMYRSSELLSFIVIAIEGISGNGVVFYASLLLESFSRQSMNKSILVDRRDILDCLFGMVSSNNLPGKIRTVAMRTIVNLASDFALANERYAKNPVYVSILIEATLDDDNDVRAAAVESIMLLSTSSAENGSSLLRLSKENILDKLLLVADDFTGFCYTRICALHAFVSLVKCKSASKIAADSILRLRNLACNSNLDPIAAHAAIGIKTVAAALAFYDDPLLLVALDATAEMASSPCLQVKMWAARCIQEQTLDASKHRLMIGTDGFLSAVRQLCQNTHPSVCRPALEAVQVLATHEVGAVAIAEDDHLLSTLVDMASDSKGLNMGNATSEIAMKALIVLVLNSDSLDKIASQRDTYVDILMELSLFGCGKDGDKSLRAEAMEAVALLAQHL